VAFAIKKSIFIEFFFNGKSHLLIKILPTPLAGSTMRSSNVLIASIPEFN
jgi:hypothetical protein